MTLAPDAVSPGRLTDLFQLGLDAPICLTWELTYACNLSCVHCLSSSGRRDPRELSTDECKAVIDTLQRMQVFYVNIGGGEPTVRPDFWELVDYATAHQVGVKFSTNGVKITPEVATRLAASDYVDVQISLDGATAEVNDAVRGPGSYATAMRAMQNLADAGFRSFKLSVVMTRQNIPQLDEFKAIADRYGAQLRLTRLRPSGRGADVWDELHPLPAQQKQLYDWLVARGEQVLTGDSFFHLSAFGSALPGLNLCGAGRVVCLIDPVGDVYACPFAIHENFLAGNVRDAGGFEAVWKTSELFQRPAQARHRRRLQVLRVLRLLPGRLHGRQVLHRPADGRPRPGVRAGLRRGGADVAGRGRRSAAGAPPVGRPLAPHLAVVAPDAARSRSRSPRAARRPTTATRAPSRASPPAKRCRSPPPRSPAAADRCGPRRRARAGRPAADPRSRHPVRRRRPGAGRGLAGPGAAAHPGRRAPGQGLVRRRPGARQRGVPAAGPPPARCRPRPPRLQPTTVIPNGPG